MLLRKARRDGGDATPYRGRVKGDELDIRSLRDRLRIDAVVVDRLGPKGQARALGVEVGDVILAYDGHAIPSRAALRERIAAAQQAGTEEILLRVRRGETSLDFTLAPGPLGIRAADRYAEPVFE